MHERSFFYWNAFSNFRLSHCKCGSILKAEILPRLENGKILKGLCLASKGEKSCGKRQLRGETRRSVVSCLEKESTHFYRAKKADDMMGEEDDAEPPHLYKASAKYEAVKK
ncbi:hypothetical protein M5D96_012672 [Drosophila gunungcola]|uniref:Uncharacterized protein n=1 Tax=Drosophila gunungcola TaxID=103775 RepID=A0A9P9YDK8_9MUSC|nr:hypothetical protein M5D96_012672 [Drosophila gunungcola]